MEILNNFGVNPFLLVAQIVNFLIVFYILKRLLYKPFLSTLKKRENEIKEGLRQAEEGRKLLEETEIKEKEILKNAQKSADKIVNDAKRESLELAKKIEDSAKEQTERMLKEAKNKIDQDVLETEEKLTKEIGRIAVKVLEKVLPDILDEKQQEQIIRKAAGGIK